MTERTLLDVCGVWGPWQEDESRECRARSYRADQVRPGGDVTVGACHELDIGAGSDDVEVEAARGGMRAKAGTGDVVIERAVLASL